MIEVTWHCDTCEKKQAARDGLPPPSGWIRIEQGAGPYGGVGTTPLPPEVDVLLNQRQFCSAKCLAAFIEARQ